jgi:uncharacterized protein
VTPKGGRDAIIGPRDTSDGQRHLAVKIAAPPADGAANESLRRLFANAAGIGRSAVTILSGEQAREKRLKLAGDPVAILAKLRAIGIEE